MDEAMSHSWLLWMQLDAQVLDESVYLERFLLEVAPLQFLTCRWVFVLARHTERALQKGVWPGGLFCA